MGMFAKKAVGAVVAVLALASSANADSLNGTEICAAVKTAARARNYEEHCDATKMESGYMVSIFRGSYANSGHVECESYISIPGSEMWNQSVRGGIYLFALLYCFLGIAIVADVFMNAIEEITSKEVEKTVTNPVSGQEEVVKVMVWNKTVANLTLMALGSSAPEILLSVLGVVTALGDPADELGPSTIVGSAAFNLLMISAVCVIAPPPGEVRRIADMGVFLCTAFFSVWAYVWLLIILDFSSKGVIDWLLTLLQFPLLVVLSYGFDKKWSFGADGKISPDLGLGKKLSYLFYRTQGIRMISGGARRTMKKTHVLPRSDEDADAEAPQYAENGATSDPYCVVKYGAQLVRTKWRRKNINPKWNAVLDLTAVDMSKEIDIEVYDHDELSSDDFMGRARLALSTPGVEKGVWIDLNNEEGLQDPKRGRVLVKVMVVPDADVVQVHVVEGRGLMAVDKERKRLDAAAYVMGSKIQSAKQKMAARHARWSEIKALWRDQFVDAITVHGDKDEDGNVSPPSGMDMLMHFLTIFWKMLFALIPPPEWGGGWVAFNVALVFIGIVTAIVGEIAGLFGCVVGLKDSVTAISFVALGTSLPDTFASRLAAVHEESADAAIGNITGSNGVNVFLGIGLPWLIGALYAEANGEKFIADSPGFGLITFLICACICLGTIIWREKAMGGALGGNRTLAMACAGVSATSWMLYLVVASLRAYDHFGDLW